ECGELSSAALAHQLRHLRLFVVREVEERRRSRKLLAHKEQRNKWRGEYKSRRNLGPVHADNLRQPLALRAVAHLVMVLDEAEEVVRRQSFHRPAMVTAAVLGVAAVVHEYLTQRFGDIFHPAEVRIVAARLRVQHREERMMEVVAPLRVNA